MSLKGLGILLDVIANGASRSDLWKKDIEWITVIKLTKNKNNSTVILFIRVLTYYNLYNHCFCSLLLA